MARLRKLRAACICHQQRRHAIPKKGNKGKGPLDPSGKTGTSLTSTVALRFYMTITPANIVRLARVLPHVRPLARRAKKRDVEDAVPYEAQTDFSAVGAGVLDSPISVCCPGSGASVSEANPRTAR